MKRHAWLGVALCCGVVLQTGMPLKATSGVTLTVLTQFLDNPIGIDWLPSGPFADDLLVSVNYLNGEPYNFVHVNRQTGAVAPWGTQHGWNN